MSSPYYSPEKFGLKVLGEMSWSEPDYGFDLTVVWTDERGTLYWANDSGCSCPSPFEDVKSIDDLVTGTEFQLFADLAEDLAARSTYRSNNDYANGEMVALIDTVRNRKPVVVETPEG